MREIIEQRLWIGHAIEARNAQTVLSAGVEALVDLATEEPPAVYPRDIPVCRFKRTGWRGKWLCFASGEVIVDQIGRL